MTSNSPPPPLPSFKVFIIESPSAEDLLIGRQEGQALSAALDLGDIPNRRFTVIDRQTFETSIKWIAIGLKNSLKEMAATGAPAILVWLHISCHGNHEGIVLSDGELLLGQNWENCSSLI